MTIITGLPAPVMHQVRGTGDRGAPTLAEVAGEDGAKCGIREDNLISAASFPMAASRKALGREVPMGAPRCVLNLPAGRAHLG